MSVLDIAGRIMRSLGVGESKPRVTREQAFQARPVRNPDLKWRENEEECVEVIIPRRKDRVGRIMGWVFAVPDSKPVVLDEVGSHIWRLCDGEHTVGDLVQDLCDEYKLGWREVEVSLTEYLRMLGKPGMIALLVPEETEEGTEGSDDEGDHSPSGDDEAAGDAPEEPA